MERAAAVPHGVSLPEVKKALRAFADKRRRLSEIKELRAGDGFWRFEYAGSTTYLYPNGVISIGGKPKSSCGGTRADGGQYMGKTAEPPPAPCTKDMAARRQVKVLITDVTLKYEAGHVEPFEYEVDTKPLLFTDRRTGEVDIRAVRIQIHRWSDEVRIEREEQIDDVLSGVVSHPRVINGNFVSQLTGAELEAFFDALLEFDLEDCAWRRAEDERPSYWRRPSKSPSPFLGEAGSQGPGLQASARTACRHQVLERQVARQALGAITSLGRRFLRLLRRLFHGLV